MRYLPLVGFAFALVLGSCKKTEVPRPGPDAGALALPRAPLPFSRGQFNRLAARLNQPLFWKADLNGNGAVDPDEVVSLLFYPANTRWTEGGRFTPDFERVREALVAAAKEVSAGLSPEERERRRLVREDLDQGEPTLVLSDLRALAPWEKNLVRQMLEAGTLVDGLHARLTGMSALQHRVPADDPASQSLFRRNWGPRCKAPRTERNPRCSAIPGAPQPIFDLYPEGLQKDPNFCETLARHPDAKKLLSPFSVVREVKGQLMAVPYAEAYREPMTAIARKLREAAAGIPPGTETALRAYLEAAAQSFTDNNWEAADAHWVAMNTRNSRWYVRIGPDETYWEPCRRKAGFHLTFARINPDSLVWQDRLKPVQQEMENTLAELIGPPYRARSVAFNLPDFIDVVFNAGEDRKELGATIGQSLPNWGKIVDQGRGRTMAVTNLYRDPDSLRRRRLMAASLLARESLGGLSDDPTPGLVATILHEATHNFGPAHDYAVQGKTAPQIFGGDLATMLEELKAQAGALWYVEWLRKKGILSAELVRQTYLDCLLWKFGHIAQGMYSAKGQRKPYPQLSAIQLGLLLDQGAVRFDPRAPAANGTDSGAFQVVFEKFPAAAEEIMKRAGRILASGFCASRGRASSTPWICEVRPPRVVRGGRRGLRPDGRPAGVDHVPPRCYSTGDHGGSHLPVVRPPVECMPAALGRASGRGARVSGRHRPALAARRRRPQPGARARSRVRREGATAHPAGDVSTPRVEPRRVPAPVHLDAGQDRPATHARRLRSAAGGHRERTRGRRGHRPLRELGPSRLPLGAAGSSAPRGHP
jgi:hypothetical protein